MPTATDLVTDLPADFEVFGQAVATSMADLLGGTTGQVLSKTTNADMDFTWVAANPGDITAVTAGTGISGGGTSGAVTITNSMATEITAKGDLIVGTGSATFDNLAAGADGSSIVADSSAATGLRYRSAAYSAKTAAYTFASGDDGKIFSMNAATSVQFNIPTDATFDFPIGTEITVFWITGAGQPTIGAVTPGTTTVISTGATSATPKLRVANSGATCKNLAANSWIVFGDIA